MNHNMRRSLDAIPRVVLLVLLLLTAFPVPAHAALDVHFERVRESPVDVTFRVTITGDTGDLPARIEFTGMTAEARVIEVKEITEVPYDVDIPIYGERETTIDDIPPEDLSPGAMDFIQNTKPPPTVPGKDGKIPATETAARLALASAKIAAEINAALARLSPLVTDVVDYRTEARIRVDKTPVARFTNGITKEFTPAVAGTRVFEVAVNTGKAVRTTQSGAFSGYGSKGVLVLDIAGNKYFDMSHSSWWDSDWHYRNVLSFKADNITANLTNYPVRVVFSAANFDFAKAAADGADVRFVDKDDTTPLPYEFEVWNAAAQTGVAWVTVPQIDAASSYSDYIYIYYGNAGATDDQDADAVWASTGAQAVWHFGSVGNNGTSIYDSTSNANTATSSNTTWSSGGQIFNGTDSFISGGTGASLNITGDLSLVIWQYRTSALGTYRTLLSKGQVSVHVPYGLQATNTNKWRFFQNVGDTGHTLDSTSSSVIGTWRQLAVTRISSLASIYIGEALDSSGNLSAAPSNAAQALIIGARDLGLTQNYGGTIKELQIYNRGLSPSEALASNLNLTDGLVYYNGTDPPPTMVTNAAVGVAMTKDGVTSGYLSGNVTDLGGAPSDNVSFQYGENISYGSETASVVVTSIGSYNATMPAALVPGQTYHYRAKGVNVDGTGYGEDQVFTFTPPTIATLPATAVSWVTSNTATLNANLSSLGVATGAYCYCQWGYASGSYPYSTSSTAFTGTGNLTATITGFTQGEVIYFRAVARVGAVQTYGSERSFATPRQVDNYPGTPQILGAIPIILFIGLITGSGIFGFLSVKGTYSMQTRLVLFAVSMVFIAVAILAFGITLDAVDALLGR